MVSEIKIIFLIKERPTSKLLENFLEDSNSVILLNPLQFDYWMDENRQVGCAMERLPRTLEVF